jgi:hypothetical protein
VFVRLSGWNDIPRGYGAEFELAEAPLWLRLWFQTPFIDRFAYPLVVRRGYGWLSRQPGEETEPIGDDGWRLRPDTYVQPGSVADLRPTHGDA